MRPHTDADDVENDADQEQLSQARASAVLDSETHWPVVAAAIEELRPAVQRDGGDLELVSIEGDRVFVRLSGACTTCAMAGHTLGGVRRHLIELLGVPVRVVPAAP